MRINDVYETHLNDYKKQEGCSINVLHSHD